MHHHHLARYRVPMQTPAMNLKIEINLLSWKPTFLMLCLFHVMDRCMYLLYLAPLEAACNRCTMLFLLLGIVFHGHKLKDAHVAHDKLAVRRIFMGACGQVDRALKRWEVLGFDSHCWSWVEVLGKPFIPYCLFQPSSNWYLVERQIGKLRMALAAEQSLHSPQRRWDCIRESLNTRGVSCKVCWTYGDINVYISLFYLDKTSSNCSEGTHPVSNNQTSILDRSSQLHI